MDEYQYCTLDDAPLIARRLREGRGVLFGYQANLTTYSIYIGPPALPVGRLPYGGMAFGRHLIGILYHGLFHFNLDKDHRLFPAYVGEKLRLDEEDANDITLMLNAIREALHR